MLLINIYRFKIFGNYLNDYFLLGIDFGIMDILIDKKG